MSSSRIVNSSPPSRAIVCSPSSRAQVSLARRHCSSRSRERDQQLVADHVAEAVVDELEAIEVEEQHGVKRLAVALAPLDRAAQPVDEQHAVRQPGQRVRHLAAR